MRNGIVVTSIAILLGTPAQAAEYLPGAAPASIFNLYFCAASDAYYPYVSTCPGGWKTVSTNPQAGFSAGMAAYRNRDFAAALQEWRPLAILGNAAAQFALGTMYENGDGIPRDYGEAVKWFRRAADQGRTDAQNNLGAMYETGHGVAQDYRLAVTWYRRAADRGYPHAQFNLGEMYANGLGVAQDYSEAVKWCRLAAAHGDADAQNSLGEMYANANGVRQSRVIAFALFSLSASNAPSAENSAAANLEQLSSSMTAAEITAAQALLHEMRRPGMLLQALDQYAN